jgi:hypothetical protein
MSEGVRCLQDNSGRISSVELRRVISAVPELSATSNDTVGRCGCPLISVTVLLNVRRRTVL